MLKVQFWLVYSARAGRRILESPDFLLYTKMDQTLDQTAAHKARRLGWAKTQHVTSRDKKNVIFSDEKHFNHLAVIDALGLA
ncbi:hypothetical protein ATCC90586_000448 [Pythium insidiosum]|nr:hypothetical protein ATCC90586_000448 [Pythium insidiosum]